MDSSLPSSGEHQPTPSLFRLSSFTTSTQHQYDTASIFDSKANEFKYYPPVPSPTDYEPSAPPLPADHAHHNGWHHQRQTPMQAQVPVQPQPGLAPGQPLQPGQVLVTAPKIEPQPWAINLWKTLAANTVGIARIDLRRPVFVEGNGDGNLLFRRRRRGGQPHSRRPYVNGAYNDYDDRQQREQELQDWQQRQRGRQQQPKSGVGRLFALGTDNGLTGARLKIMRCAQLFPQQKLKGRPLLDFGVGLGYDLDKQSLHGIVRCKFTDWLSLKLAPEPLLKLGGSYSPPGTRMALRLRYECPLSNLDQFWRAPARLMLRLDNNAGTGIHLSPSGIEFDERVLTLGQRAQIRGSAMLRFPRQLPLDPDDPDAFKLQVHRLSFKSQW